MLNLNHVNKQYKHLRVLSDINLSFQNGIYGILAPNGAGKTTLLKLITTLLSPDSGEILYNGKNITYLDEQYREILGFLPQDFGYYADYSVYKFLKYIGVLKGLKGKSLVHKIDEVLTTVELSQQKKVKMKHLSGGMKQRVGIAQALLNDPKILVLDEPTASLDISQRVAFKRILSKLATNAIVIVSTHIVSDIESIANEIILLKDKTVFFKGTVPQLIEQYQSIAYTTTVGIDDIASFESRYHVVNKRIEGNNMICRVLMTETPSFLAQQVTPTLEDVYLCVFNEQKGVI